MRPAFERVRAGGAVTPASVPGLEVRAGWVDADEAAALLAAVDASPWRADLQRRVQHYGFRYDYRARRVDASMRLGALPGWADALAQRIEREGLFDRAADQVIVNEYQPGEGISRHVDCVPCFGPVVLSLSLGSACVMDLYPPGEARGATGASVPVVLPPRSLLVLRGAARSAWAHAIAARKSDVIDGVRVPRGRRVSLTFRTVRLHDPPAP